MRGASKYEGAAEHDPIFIATQQETEATRYRSPYVGTLCRLQMLADDTTMLVATTHLAWGRDKEDVREVFTWILYLLLVLVLVLVLILVLVLVLIVVLVVVLVVILILVLVLALISSSCLLSSKSSTGSDENDAAKDPTSSRTPRASHFCRRFQHHSGVKRAQACDRGLRPGQCVRRHNSILFAHFPVFVGMADSLASVRSMPWAKV